MERLSLKELTIYADHSTDPIIRSVNLGMGEGQIFGLLGPNGCGKTSLVRAIAGFIPINGTDRSRVYWGSESRRMSGTVLIDGQDISKLPPGDRGIAMVPQNLALYPDKTVLENIAFPLRTRGATKVESFSQAAEMSKWLGIAEILNRRPSEISGGQQQRVAIGRALIARPRLLLLDEPLASMDSLSKNDVLSFISRTLRERGASAIYVTHDSTEATVLCDQVAFINNHCVQQIATPAEAYNKPATIFVARMFSGFTNIVRGHLNDDGVFVPVDAVGHWDLASMVGDSCYGMRGEFLLAGRPEAFQLSKGGHGTIRGRLVGKLTLNGLPYARVEVANGTQVVGRIVEDVCSQTVDLSIAQDRLNDLRLFDLNENLAMDPDVHDPPKKTKKIL